MNFVVMFHASLEADAEDGHGGDLGSTEVAQLAGLGHARSQVAGQIGGLVGLKICPCTLGMHSALPTTPSGTPKGSG